jgi:rhamnulokinase
MQEKAFQRMPQKEIYLRTGIHSMFFNTLYQLLAEMNASYRLEKAERLLFISDLFHYFLSGVCSNEKSMASTSQLLNPRTKLWESHLIEIMNLPLRTFGNLVNAGTKLGELKPEVAIEIGASKMQVITPAGHDTASAVVGVPADEPEPAFLSSGTWSLMGRELNSPVISEESYQAGFSNEGGVFGTTRFLKSITGMWLLQECNRSWDSAGMSIEYVNLVAQADRSPSFKTIIDPDAEDFKMPVNMPEAITAFSHRTRQIPPATFGEFTRTILESLALKYRLVKESLTHITGKSIDKLYVVGGGSQNSLLNQFAADALNCPVVAGPVEATSIDNIIMQLYALGEIRSLAEGRALVRHSFETKIFEPQNPTLWNDAYNRFQNILTNNH